MFNLLRLPFSYGINMYNPYFQLMRQPYRPNCLYWVKTKGKKVRRTKKGGKR